MDDAELLDILEPHYVNMGFAWGEEAREAARKSVTFKQLKARDAAKDATQGAHYSHTALLKLKSEWEKAARIDELENCCDDCGFWHGDDETMAMTFAERRDQLEAERRTSDLGRRKGEGE